VWYSQSGPLRKPLGTAAAEVFITLGCRVFMSSNTVKELQSAQLQQQRLIPSYS